HADDNQLRRDQHWSARCCRGSAGLCGRSAQFRATSAKGAEGIFEGLSQTRGDQTRFHPPRRAIILLLRRQGPWLESRFGGFQYLCRTLRRGYPITGQSKLPTDTKVTKMDLRVIPRTKPNIPYSCWKLCRS